MTSAPELVAAVSADLTPTDVTPRALSLVWSSDESVVDATLRIWSDANGTTELTAGLSVVSIGPAVDNGLARVDVRIREPGPDNRAARARRYPRPERLGQNDAAEDDQS